MEQNQLFQTIPYHLLQGLQSVVENPPSVENFSLLERNPQDYACQAVSAEEAQQVLVGTKNFAVSDPDVINNW